MLFRSDVRTAPYSRHSPHFNRDALRKELRHDGIAYVFLGHELGGRPKEKQLFRDGVADYEKMARLAEFRRRRKKPKKRRPVGREDLPRSVSGVSGRVSRQWMPNACPSLDLFDFLGRITLNLSH